MGAGKDLPWAVTRLAFCSVCKQSGHRTQEVGTFASGQSSISLAKGQAAGS